MKIRTFQILLRCWYGSKARKQHSSKVKFLEKISQINNLVYRHNFAENPLPAKQFAIM